MNPVLIHIDHYKRIDPFVAKYKTILDANGIPSEYVSVEQSDFWEKCRQTPLFIFRYQHYDWYKQIAHSILPIIENEMGIKVFPNQATSWHFDDKIKQFYLMEAKGFPFIKSWVFYEKDSALNWAETAEYPLVFKLNEGAGSSNVMLVTEKKKAVKLIERMFGKGINPNTLFMPGSTRLLDFQLKVYLLHVLSRIKRKEDIWPFWRKHKNYVCFQTYLPNNEFDTRITVIGNRAFAFRRFNRQNDFRSSGSGLINYDMEKIDMRCVETAFRVSKEMKLQSMGYDFLFDADNQPHFCEISYTFQDKAVYECPGYWDEQLNWHAGHFWPQYCQLSDLLNRKLIQPEIE